MSTFTENIVVYNDSTKAHEPLPKGVRIAKSALPEDIAYGGGGGSEPTTAKRKILVVSNNDALKYIAQNAVDGAVGSPAAQLGLINFSETGVPIGFDSQYLASNADNVLTFSFPIADLPSYAEGIKLATGLTALAVDYVLEWRAIGTAGYGTPVPADLQWNKVTDLQNGVSSFREFQLTGPVIEPFVTLQLRGKNVVAYNGTTSMSVAAVAQPTNKLVVGSTYIVRKLATGDSFTNVGMPAGVTTAKFVATGTTPAAWANSYVYKVESVGAGTVEHINTTGLSFTYDYSAYSEDSELAISINSGTNQIFNAPATVVLESTQHKVVSDTALLFKVGTKLCLELL